MKFTKGRLGTGKTPGEWASISDPVARRAAYVKQYRRLKYESERIDPELVEIARIRAKDWYAANKTRALACCRKNYEQNKAKHYARSRAWIKINPDKNRAYKQKRRATKISRTHPLHDFATEEAMCRRCSELELLTGAKHHIDHIIPLSRGGWHHHENLQILPARINAKKHNNPTWKMDGYKNWGDVPEFLWPEGLVSVYKNLKK